MNRDLFHIDGSYQRLGFLLLPNGDFIPFGYTNMYDVIQHIGHANIDYTYHNSALTAELKHNPKLQFLKSAMEKDYGTDLIYSPDFPQGKVLNTIAGVYGITCFKKVNTPDFGEDRDFLFLQKNITEQEYQILRQLNENTKIFQRLLFCCQMISEDEYIDYENIESFFDNYNMQKRESSEKYAR